MSAALHAGSRIVWSLAAFALALRLAALCVLPGAGHPQLFEYEVIARRLLAGEGFRFRYLGVDYVSFHSAVPYIWLNAATCWLTGHRHVWLLVVQGLATALLVVVVFRIGTILFDRQVAAVASFLTAVHPGLLAYDTRRLHPLSLDGLLIAAAVLLMLSLTPHSSPLRRIVAGVVMGLGVLERGTLVAFAVIVPLWIARTFRPSLSTGIRYAAPVFLGLVVTVGPWIARNYLIHGTVVAMTASGEHFWRGNHRGATGTSYARDGRDVREADGSALISQLRGLGELEQMRAFTRAGLSLWRAAPGEAAALYARKLVYFFGVTPTAGRLYRAWELRTYLAFYAVCALLAVLGASRVAMAPAAGARRASLMTAFCIVTVGALQAVFYVETRHRWGVEPLILVFTAAGALALWRWATGSGSRLAGGREASDAAGRPHATGG